MCWICEKQDSITRYSTDNFGLHYGDATGRYTTAFPVDGVGDLKPPVLGNTVITTPDEAGDAKDAPPGNPVITVGAPSTIGTINTNGDQDFFQVTLEAGQTYEIGMYGFSSGPNGVPLADAFVELYAADGTTLIVSADGGANTPANDVNSGFDVLLTFTAETSGTYYINARAYDNDATDGSTGEGVGDYELFARVQDPNDPNIYRPYYEPDDPLYALDWGTQVNKVNQSARNPDGSEGTRDTGNAQGTPTYGQTFSYDPDGAGPQSAQSFDNVADLASAQGKDITGKNVITIYFAKEGDVFASNNPTNPGLPPATVTASAVQDFERTAVFTSLAEFEKVADVIYLEVDDRTQADFVYTSYKGTPGPGVSLLGSMSPPDEDDEGLAQFNSGDQRWNARDLAQGGFSFVTLIHEFGHGHGLAHPHDNGGRSGIMRGVEEESAFNYTTGDFDLNQGVFTMMSYEDGWQSSPYGNASTSAGYGYLGGLMAFDIAVIQDKYGVNEDWATGNDTYAMKDENAAGTFYYSIWDGGGTDEITYGGARNATIDLRPATLRYETGGGGNVSFAFGIFGGFTIANGVTIENATSGAGNDVLRGNDVDNILTSNGGNDIVFALAGNDTLDGGDGEDHLEGGEGRDRLNGGLGRDYMFGGTQGDRLNGGGDGDIMFGQSGEDVLAGEDGDDYLDGGDERDVLAGDAGRDDLRGGTGNDTLRGGADGDLLSGDDGEDELRGEDGFDYLNGGNGRDYLFGGAGADFALGGAGGDIIFGEADEDDLRGDDGDDYLDGGSERDLLFGGAGRDDLRGGTGNDSLLGGAGVDLLSGNEGDDELRGEDGNDFADGAAGRDSLFGGAGGDDLRGGLDGDVLFGEADEDFLFGDDGDDFLDGGDARDVLSGSSGRDDLRGGAGHDTMRGGADGDLLFGGDDEDELRGEDGDDYLSGGSGRDYLFGGTGGDLLLGGAGSDIMFGNEGADRFQFASAGDSSVGLSDFLADFNRDQGDHIDLSLIDAISGSADNDAFTFVGTAAFSNKAGELRFEVIGNETHVFADLDGDAVADMSFIVNTTDLRGGDFIL